MAMPGDTVHFFAATRSGSLVKTAPELIARLRARRLRTTYVREYLFPFRMMPDRVRELDLQTRPQPGTALNRDFAPIAYYFDTALWSAQFDRGSRRWFSALARLGWGRLAAGLALASLALAVSLGSLRRRETRVRAAAAYCTGAMGLTMIGLELLLLLAFQAVYGYVYQQLAALIAAFMAGMALGSWWALRRRSGIWSLARLQALGACAPLVFYPALATAPSAAFPLLALFCGALGGYQFVAASRAYFAHGGAASPGAIYGIDLAGACVGAVALSAWLIPVFGFFRTASLLALVNAAPAALAAAVALRTPPPKT
jgi:spermidine synthase